jgi:methyl-accepting chemotaxis protein
MTTSIRARLVLAGLLCAALAPSAARAQAHTMKSGATTSADALTSQEKEMLALANDLARRCAATLEKWISGKETTEEKLFSALYYPIAKTDPPKYNTDWDRLSDRDVLPLEEAVLTRSPSIVFAVLVDRNGYLPTHNQRFSQPLTGNPAVDLVNNRTKLIFMDSTGLAAARNLAPFLVQRYQRDTGETMVDLSVPVTLRGAHWGAVRIGFRAIDAT